MGYSGTTRFTNGTLAGATTQVWSGFIIAYVGTQAEWEPQQKLDAVVAHLAEYRVNAARERYFQRESAELREETEQNVHW